MHQAYNIAGQLEDVVGVNRRWSVGLSIAALVWRHGVVSSFCEGGYLVSPGIPTLRKTVTQDHEWALTLLSNVHPDPVGVDEPVVHLCHVSSSRLIAPALGSRTIELSGRAKRGPLERIV